MTVCLFDELGTETQLPTTAAPAPVRHCYLPGVGPGQRYGFRTAADPRLLLTDPYARRRLEGGLRWDAGRLRPPGTPPRTSRGASSSTPRTTGGPTRARATTTPTASFYELHVRGFTRQLEEVPVELRGTYAGLGHPGRRAEAAPSWA